MDLIICFIDDSGFEHDLVRNEIAPCEKRVEFLQAYTFDEARNKLEGRIPGLFLLDLWGQDMEVEDPYITPREDLDKLVSGFNTLDYVYEGLDSFSGDRTNEYLKRFFSIVESWRSLFEAVCSRIGQNNKYGLHNLKCARAEYPGVPAVFYTRKSMINDAVQMIKAGTEGLFIKPTGKNDEETRHITREFAPELHNDFYTKNLPQTVKEVKCLINYWKEFKNI
jgi:DNA-binding NarL/FixJ family response regulator